MSLSVRLTFRSADRTLTDAEVQRASTPSSPRSSASTARSSDSTGNPTRHSRISDGEDSDPGVDLEPIDRLEEKLKLLVGMVDRMKAEQARAAEENQRLSRELDALRARLAASDGRRQRADALREERDIIRTRVRRDARAARGIESVTTAGHAGGQMTCADRHMAEGRVISVEIHGQRYPIRSTLEPEYVARLAASSTRGCAPPPNHAHRRFAAPGRPGRAQHRGRMFRCRDAIGAQRAAAARRARRGASERLASTGVLMACNRSCAKSSNSLLCS